jgi:hypothetical protein
MAAPKGNKYAAGNRGGGAPRMYDPKFAKMATKARSAAPISSRPWRHVSYGSFCQPIGNRPCRPRNGRLMVVASAGFRADALLKAHTVAGQKRIAAEHAAYLLKGLVNGHDAITETVRPPCACRR